MKVLLITYLLIDLLNEIIVQILFKSVNHNLGKFKATKEAINTPKAALEEYF